MLKDYIAATRLPCKSTLLSYAIALIVFLASVTRPSIVMLVSINMVSLWTPLL